MSNMMDDFFNAPPDDFDPNAGNNPKPHEGKQICMVTLFGPKDTQKKGTILRVDLMIVQPAPGSAYKQGDRCGVAWFVNESDSTKRRYERARADDFVNGLLGLPARTRSGQQSNRLSQADQPGKGMLIVIYGERNGQWLNFRFEHIPQTNEQIVSNRSVVDRAVAAQESASGLPGGHPVVQAPHPAATFSSPQATALVMPQTQYAPPTTQQYYQAPQPSVPVQPQVGIPGLPGIKF